MKKLNIKYTILFIIIMLIAKNSKSQWQPDVRLTNDTAESKTSYNNGRCIASSGDSVHAVWQDKRDGNFSIYYKRSTDGGISWGKDYPLTASFADSKYPSVSVSGSFVHVVWLDLREEAMIYYKRSSDGGTSWCPDLRLTFESVKASYPSISVYRSAVHVVWMDVRDKNSEIYYKNSEDDGLSWGPDIRLTKNASYSSSPSVSVSGSNVHVAWDDYRDGDLEIYYKRSVDGGKSWGTDKRLSISQGASVVPSISVSGSDVHIVWSDERHVLDEIYYRRSTDNGVSWEAVTRLTNHFGASLSPSITVSGQFVHVVWDDFRNNLCLIYYKRSSNGGVSWDPDKRLTNGVSASSDPFVCVSGPVIHVLWKDYRDRNHEIYYKRNPFGENK